jgi:long-chain fatty acid transport protein
MGSLGDEKRVGLSAGRNKGSSAPLAPPKLDEEMIMAIYPGPGLRNRAFFVAGLLSLTATAVNASSFALIEQSVSGMGSAYAIGAAGIDDASTLFFNPAGMSRLPDTNLSAGLQIVNSRVDIDATANYIAAAGGAPILDKNTGGPTSSLDTDLTAAVPAGYITHQYSDKLWAGFAINAHFGLETEYNDSWVGRYHANKSELLTLDFNPSVAFKLNDRATLALGASALYADGRLSNVLDAGLQGGAPGALDLDAVLKGDDWGFGFNAGLLLEPNENTRLGLHYRHKIDLDIEGNIYVTGQPALGAKLPITLPGSLSASIYHALNDQWAVMADWTWTDWSQVQKLDIQLADGRQRVNDWLYDDSNRYSIGTEYRHSRVWTFRAGIALDETPVPSDADRSPVVPDADRTWLSFGATYRRSPDMTIDLGYAHLFVDDPKLDNVASASDPSQGQPGFHLLSGNYDAAVDIVGVQLNWKWK